MKTFSDSEKVIAALRSEIAVRIYKVQKDVKFIEDELAVYDFDAQILKAVEECLRTACSQLKVATGEILAAIEKKEETKVLEDIK